MAKRTKKAAPSRRRLFGALPAMPKTGTRRAATRTMPAVEKDPVKAFMAFTRKEIKDAGGPKVIENIMDVGEKLGPHMEKIAKSLGTSTATKIAEKVILGSQSAQNIHPEDAIMESSIRKVSVAGTSSVKSRMFRLSDRVTHRRSKYLQERIKEVKPTKVVLRDDLSNPDNPGYTPPNDEHANRQVYSQCGINRKGIFFPTQTITGNPALPTASYINKGYYDLLRPYHSLCFMAQDYNRMFYLQAMNQYYTTYANIDTEERERATRILPLVSKELIVTIQNRNAFYGVDFTLYLLRNNNATSGVMKYPAPYYWVGDPATTVDVMQEEYIYPRVTDNILNNDGTSAGVTFNVETSVHLKATPFLSNLFRENLEVVKVHKFKLEPKDTMEYHLTVDCNGLNYDYVSDQTSDFLEFQRLLNGDYQVMISFQGAERTVANFKKVAAGPVITYPKQLSVSNVTNPCEVSVHTKCIMSAAIEDYHQYELPSSDRLINWDGTASWFATPSTDVDAVFRRLSVMEMLSTNVKRTLEKEDFNLAYTDLVTSTDANEGYYVQAETDTQYVDVNSQATPT